MKWFGKQNFFIKVGLVALIGFLLVTWFGTCQTQPSSSDEATEASYSQFLISLDKGDVTKVVIHQKEGAPSIDVMYRAGMVDYKIKPLPKEGYAPLLDDLVKKYNIKPDVEVEKPSGFGAFLSTYGTLIIPLLFLALLIFFLYRVGSAGGANQAKGFAKSGARIFSRPTVTFKDVAGAVEAKEELGEVVEFLKFPEHFTVLGARIPRGVLMIGPPGCGKTLLAKAVAGEAGVPFFSISGSEFVEMFVGVGASRVRDLFVNAKRNAPCIIFIDEIDAVGRQRGAGLGGSHDEREQTLNQILVEMDGFDTSTNVIVIAATNRPDILDPALRRPGRFDRQVLLDRPDWKERLAILEVHMKGKPIEEGIDLSVVAKQTPGATGADLANIANEAAILTGRRKKSRISMNELNEAVDRALAGPERKSHVFTDRERTIIAWHEAGHAWAAWLTPGADIPYKVSIVARGMAGGFTRFLPEDDTGLRKRSELKARLVTALGGYNAEKLLLTPTRTAKKEAGDPEQEQMLAEKELAEAKKQYERDFEVTSGPHNDLEHAMQVAKLMVTKWGMSEAIGPLSLGKDGGAVFLGRDIAETKDYSEQTAKEIDQEVRHLIVGASREAFRKLFENRLNLEKLVHKLCEVETLEGDELREFLEKLSPRAVA